MASAIQFFQPCNVTFIQVLYAYIMYQFTEKPFQLIMVNQICGYIGKSCISNLKKCSDRSVVVKPNKLLGNNDRQTDGITDRPGHHREVSLPINRLTNKLHMYMQCIVLNTVQIILPATHFYSIHSFSMTPDSATRSKGSEDAAYDAAVREVRSVLLDGGR